MRYFTRCLLGLALLLSVMPVHAAAPATQPASEKDYSAVFLEGKKIGHAVHGRTESAGRVTTQENMELTIKSGPLTLKIREEESSVETADGKPLSFRSVQDMGMAKTIVEGNVADGNVTANVTSSGRTKTEKFPWPKGAVMPEGARLEQLRQGLKEGTRYTVKAFSANMLKAIDTEMTVGGMKDVDLLGRTLRLTEVRSVTKGFTGEMPATAYVDANGDALKMVMPLVGKSIEVVSCSKEFAFSKNDVRDFFNQMLLDSPQPLEPAKARSITYTLAATQADANLVIPVTDNQAVRKTAAGVYVVTVTPLSAAVGEAFPYKGDDKVAQAALKPSRYIQSDSNEIVALSRKAIGDAKDSAEAVKRIERFVTKYITRKELSVAPITSLDVARMRSGDCKHHSVLAAGLCRAAGIPARVVVGVAYVDKFGGKTNVFGPHEWVQAYVGGKWVGLDAALRGFDAGHIALDVGDGDPSDFFGLATTLGCFKITKAEVKE